MALRRRSLAALALPLVLTMAGASAQAQDKSKDAPQTASAPVRTETTTYENWNTVCRSTVGTNDKPDCVAELQVRDQKSNTLVIVWRVRRENGKLVMHLQVPNGVKIKPGVEARLGDDKVETFDYDTCTPQNCEASGVLDEALVNKIDAASIPFHLLIQSAAGQAITFDMPVKGIRRATEALTASK